MDRIIIGLGRSANRRFHWRARECENPKLVTHYHVLINLDEGRSVAGTALALQVARPSATRWKPSTLRYRMKVMGIERPKSECMG